MTRRYKYCLQHAGNMGVVAADEQLCPPTRKQKKTKALENIIEETNAKHDITVGIKIKRTCIFVGRFSKNRNKKR